MEEIKQAGARYYNRLVVEKLQKLSIHDALGLDDTREDIEKLRKFVASTEYVADRGKLFLAQELKSIGDFDTAIKELTDVYSQKKNDLNHIGAIIGLIEFSNISVEKENRIVVGLANEGLKIAEELENETGIAILLVYRAEAIHLTVIMRILQSLYTKKAMESMDIAVLVEIETNKRIIELTKYLTNIAKDVEEAFKRLQNERDYHILTYLQTIILDMATRTIQLLGPLIGKEKFDAEIKSNDILSQHLLDVIEVFKDDHLELRIRESVANYYYYTRGGTAGLKILEPASKIAEKQENQPQIEKIHVMIDMCKTRPDPFNIQIPKIEDLSTKEFAEHVKFHVKLQGFDLSDDSDASRALNIGIKDMDPEPYLKFCKELFIHYLGTSYLGEITGVEAIGDKLLWCKHSSVTCMYHLDEGFETHKEHYCKDCKHRKPRADNWVCTVGWIKKRNVPKPIRDYEEEMMKRYDDMIKRYEEGIQ